MYIYPCKCVKCVPLGVIPAVIELCIAPLPPPCGGSGAIRSCVGHVTSRSRDSTLLPPPPPGWGGKTFIRPGDLSLQQLLFKCQNLDLTAHARVTPPPGLRRTSEAHLPEPLAEACRDGRIRLALNGGQPSLLRACWRMTQKMRTAHAQASVASTLYKPARASDTPDSDFSPLNFSAWIPAQILRTL
jgi:hypothetical protein